MTSKYNPKTGLSYEEWVRQKEIQRRLKERLLKDAMVSWQQIKEEYKHHEEQLKLQNQKVVEEWMHQKEK